MNTSPLLLHTNTCGHPPHCTADDHTCLLFPTHRTMYLPNISCTNIFIIHTYPLMKCRCENSDVCLLAGHSSPQSRKKKGGASVCGGASRPRHTLSPTLFTALILKVASPAPQLCSDHQSRGSAAWVSTSRSEAMIQRVLWRADAVVDVH